MMSKVILFGVLIFYSNFVVSVPYPEELGHQRVYWPPNWSGNEHARRQIRNEHVAPIRNENHLEPVRQPANNQEYNSNPATHSSYYNIHNNNNPVVLPVPNKQSLPHFGSPAFKREFDPNPHIAPQGVPYPHNVDGSQINTNNRQLRNQNQNPQIQHPSSSYIYKQEQPSYVPQTGTHYRRKQNASPIDLEYRNEATKNVANKEHVVRQIPHFRQNGPLHNGNLGVSNDNVSENVGHSEQNTSFSTYNRNQVASEVKEVISNTASEREHNRHEPRKIEPHFIANHLVQRNENNNFGAHTTQTSKLTQSDVLANEPGNRKINSKNVGPVPVNTYNTASELTSNVAVNNHENLRFIKINRSGSEYRIPVIPLNAYAEIHDQKDSFIENRAASNYREALPIENVASTNDAVVHNPENNFPVNIPEENRYHRSKPIRQYHNSPRVVSSNLVNENQNIAQEHNNNNQEGSGFRDFILGDGYNKEHQVLRNHLANNNKASSVSRDSSPDNIYNAAAQEKHVVKERKLENTRYANNKNQGLAYDLKATNNYENVPVASPNVVKKPNNDNVRHTEVSKLSFNERDIKPEQYSNNLPMPENVRTIKHNNIRHIVNVGEGFRKRNFGDINAPEAFGNHNDYDPENIGHVDNFRVRSENRHNERVDTYDRAPAVVNHNEANNRESSSYFDNDRANSENYNSAPLDKGPALINNVEENNKEYRAENYRHIENSNNAIGNPNHIPSNTYNHNPAAKHIRTQVPNNRFTDDNVTPSNNAPLALINDEAYNPENSRYNDDDRTGLDYRDPSPALNRNDVLTILDYIENNPEDGFLDHEPTVFGPFKTYQDALEIIKEIDADKHEKPINGDNYGPISQNRKLDTLANTPLPVQEISENIVNRESNTDIFSNNKSEDQASITTINNVAPNVQSDAVNSNAENPNLGNQNKPQPGPLEHVLSDISNSDQIVPHQLPTEEQNLNNVSSKKNHFVLVQADGTLEELNNVDNTIDEKYGNNIVNGIAREDKVAEESFTAHSPKNVSITATTPVLINTDINKNINNEIVNKDDQQKAAVEEIYESQSQTVDNAAPNLIAASPPVPEKDNALPTNTNLPVNNNDLNSISPVEKDTEVNSLPLALLAIIPEPLPLQSIANEPNSNKALLPTEYTTVVATPYPDVTSAPPLELITDNVNDNLATTTVSPITKSTTVSENYVNGEQNEVHNDNTNNNTSSVVSSQNYYTVNVTDITSDSLRNRSSSDATEQIASNYNNTRSEDKIDAQQIINQSNEAQLVAYNSPPNGDVLTNGDDEIVEHSGVITVIPDGNIDETRSSPYGIKLVLDPSSVAEDDTITIAIELAEGLDGTGSKGGVQVFNVSPRNGADGYSNEVLNIREEYPTVNGKPVWVRAAHDHNIRIYDDEIEPYPVYLIPMEPQPVMEKETHITQYPNGTIVTVITEVVYDNQEGTPPKITRIEKIGDVKDQ